MINLKKYTKVCIELVQLTETAEHAPEFVVMAGRNLLTSSAQLKSALISWVNGDEPEWYLEEKAWDQYQEQYEEYYDEGYNEEVESGNRAPPPPPPPINFSAPTKLKMIETGQKSNMTQEMIDEIENRRSQNNSMQDELNNKMKSLRGTDQSNKGDLVDELLMVIQSGLTNLKPVSERKIALKPLIPDVTICAFNIVDQIMARRLAVEGDDEEDWSQEEEWSDDEED